MNTRFTLLLAAAASVAAIATTAHALPTSLTQRYVVADASADGVRPSKLRPLVLAQASTSPAKSADLATKTATAVDMDKLIGHSVKNTKEEKIGDINSVYVDKNGKIVSVIVGIGGFLGVGEREVAIAWNDLTVSQDGTYVRTTMTKDQLKALPEYKFKDVKWRGTVFRDGI
jgi:sulfite reductase beta subunit-like hemoprotein